MASLGSEKEEGEGGRGGRVVRREEERGWTGLAETIDGTGTAHGLGLVKRLQLDFLDYVERR